MADADNTYTVKEILLDFSKRTDVNFEELKDAFDQLDKRVQAVETWREGLVANAKMLTRALAAVATMAGIGTFLVYFLPN